MTSTNLVIPFKKKKKTDKFYSKKFTTKWKKKLNMAQLTIGIA